MTQVELKNRVEKVLAEEAAPALMIDGAAIEVIGVENGVVRLRLNGVCAGCPATIPARSSSSTPSRQR